MGTIVLWRKTYVLCSYCAKNLHALKNKNKKFLSVFWQHNVKAWVRVVLFTEWFHECSVPEVKEYLEKEGLPLKVLLIIDNVPGHPQSIGIEDENVQVVFLPPNMTSLLQPLEQGILRCQVLIHLPDLRDDLSSH